MALIRYRVGESPYRAVKGQRVSTRVEINDGGGDVYVYGEVSENRMSTSPTIKIKLLNSLEIS